MNTLQAMNVSFGEHPEGKIDLLKLPPPVRAALTHAAGVHLGPDLWAKEATEGVFDLSLPWAREACKIVLATCPESWIPGVKDSFFPKEPLDPSEGLVWRSTIWVYPVGQKFRIVWEITGLTDSSGASRHVFWTFPFLPQTSPEGTAFPYDKWAPLTFRILRHVLLALHPPEGDTWDPAGGWVSWNRLG